MRESFSIYLDIQSTPPLLFSSAIIVPPPPIFRKQCRVKPQIFRALAEFASVFIGKPTSAPVCAAECRLCTVYQADARLSSAGGAVRTRGGLWPRRLSACPFSSSANISRRLSARPLSCEETVMLTSSRPRSCSRFPALSGQKNIRNARNIICIPPILCYNVYVHEIC